MIPLLGNALAPALAPASVLAAAALGALLAERVGVLNLGIEGLLALGAVGAVIAADATGSAWAGLLAALALGALAGLVFALATVVARANQVLCGMALTLGLTGLAATVGRPYAGQPVMAVFQPVLHQSLPGWLALLALPLVLHLLLFHTRLGLSLRAAGENPSAADAAGVPVQRLRVLAVTAGAALSAGGGALLTLGFVPSWSEGVVAGRGWIAVALVIFARHRPWPVAFGALLFGLIEALGYLAQARGWGVPPPLLSMLPYLATLLCMLLPGQQAGPAALGLAWFRDQR